MFGTSRTTCFPAHGRVSNDWGLPRWILSEGPMPHGRTHAHGAGIEGPLETLAFLPLLAWHAPTLASSFEVAFLSDVWRRNQRKPKPVFSANLRRISAT